MFGPAITIPAPTEPLEGPDLTALGIAIGMALYGLAGVVLTALALWG